MRQFEGIDQQLVRNLSIREWSTVASLVVLLWEYVIAFADEARHIWCQPVNGVKAAYIFARYFAIVVQISNVYLVFGPLRRLYIPEHVCKQWFLFLAICVCFLVTTLDAVLMLRVYALYRKDWRAAAFLVVLFFTKIALLCLVAPRSVLHVPYDPICDTTKTHPDAIYCLISMSVTHVPICILTAAKWKLVKIGVPVVRLITRDGALTTVSLCSLYAFVIANSLSDQVSQAHVVFNWPMTLLSVACCRIIMNMQTLNVSGNHDSTVNSINTTNFVIDSLNTFPLDRNFVQTPTSAVLTIIVQ